MKKFNLMILIFITLIILLITVFFMGGRIRTDVYLKDFELSNDGKSMTLKVGVSSSIGYIRKMKKTGDDFNYYYTFYATFGLNSKLGSKDTFVVELNDVNEIYFYIGNGGYRKVLEKDQETGKWEKVLISFDNEIKAIVDKTKNIKDFACAEALEGFYEDSEYTYYYSCIKGKYMVVIYQDGSEETISDALKDRKITIKDLDNYGIDYIKEKKFK